MRVTNTCHRSSRSRLPFGRLAIVLGLAASGIALAPAALAESGALPPPGSTPSDARTMSATLSDNGWTMSCAALQTEQRAELRYSYAAQPARTVEGTKVGQQWKFTIADRIPADAMVTADVTTYSKLDEKGQQAAELELRRFVQQLVDVLVAAYDDAASATRGAADQESVLGPTFQQKAGVALTQLIEASPLSNYNVDGDSVLTLLLQTSAFEKSATGQWQPTLATFERLSGFWDEMARRYQSASGLVVQLPTAMPCAASLKPDSADGAAEEVLRGCWKDFVAKARQAADAAGEGIRSTMTPPTNRLDTAQQPMNVSQLLRPARPDDDPRDPNHGNKEFLEGSSDADFQTVIAADPDRSAELGSDYEGVRFAAALLTQRALEDKVWSRVFDVPWTLAGVAHHTSYIGRASQLFEYKAGKARFFVSTGVLATALRGDWQLSLPVLASVCLSALGCETKGTGATSDGGQYVSIDLGLKAVFLGDKDARESAPSFLLGFGITPIYATHFSVGLNAFVNPQTHRSNGALYVAVTLDLVDGADILGALALGKPSLEPIGGAEAKPGD
jgi:hypothetical protein